jgi:hypothetical protein
MPASREAAMTKIVEAQRAGAPNIKEAVETTRRPRSFTDPGHLWRGLFPGRYA